MNSNKLNIKVIVLPYWVDQVMKNHNVTPLSLARSNNLDPLTSLLTADEKQYYLSQLAELFGSQRSDSAPDVIRCLLSDTTLVTDGLVENTAMMLRNYRPNPSIVELPSLAIDNPVPFINPAEYVDELESPLFKHVLVPEFEAIGENTLVIRFLTKQINASDATKYNTELLKEVIKQVLKYVDFDEFMNSNLFRLYTIRGLQFLN